MKVLAIGHSFIVDNNRKFWSLFAKESGHIVDLIAPLSWKSNLASEMRFKENNKTDFGLRRLIPLTCYGKGKGSFFIFDLWHLYKILRSEKYDAIYLWQETWAFSSLELVWLKRLTQNKHTKLYLHVCQNIKKEKLYWMRHFEKYICRSVEALLCCCEEIKEVIQWKNIPVACKYFPFAYDETVYTNNQQQQTPRRLTLGYMGRLSSEKGIETLIQACDKLVEHGLDFKLKIAGAGPLAQKLKQKPFVDFKGLIPHIQAHQFYDDVDIFILPSETTSFWKEQFGRVLVEATVSGCLVIGSNSGAIPEVLGLLEMPYIFQEGQNQHLVDMILTAQKHMIDGHSQQIIENSIRLAQKHFSSQATAQRFIKLVEEI